MLPLKNIHIGFAFTCIVTIPQRAVQCRRFVAYVKAFVALACLKCPIIFAVFTKHDDKCCVRGFHVATIGWSRSHILVRSVTEEAPDQVKISPEQCLSHLTYFTCESGEWPVHR